jgi:hypothetical protein
MKKLGLLTLAAALVLVVSSCTCGTETPPDTPDEPTKPSGATSVPSEPADAPDEPTAEPTEVPPTGIPTPEGLPPLPPDPQKVEFQAEDGQVLMGTYYPAATNPAPTVVLMHWAPGDQNEWPAIAAWLQDRGLEVTPGAEPWLDSSWFPPMLEGQSFAVFMFTFRGCDGGCSSYEPEGWLLDAKAAMKTASELDGVDPTRMVAIGASIGSDGAVDACGKGCLGALSLSPGSYLGVPYDEAVAAVDGAGNPVWCLAAEGDAESAPTCRSASGDLYGVTIYPSSRHGMQLIDPEVEPGALGLILDFLKLAFGL